LASTYTATSPTSPPTYFDSFKASLEQRELEADQWDSLLSLALRGLARSTDGWDAPWAEEHEARARYDHIEGVVALGEYVFLNRPAEHHAEMLEFVLDCIYRRTNGVVLEPRGAAKTTWGNSTLLTWLVAKFPDIRIGLISNTSKQTADFSRAIRYTIESNSRFREIFGDCVSTTKWTDVEWLHRDSKWHGSKDVTLYAAGAGGAIISKRFDIIFCDDILDEENTATPEAREKVENWFLKTLLPCLVPDGTVICLGTRWAEGDLYEHLTESIEKGGKGWRLMTRQALTEDDTKPEGYRSYWEEHWPCQKLLDKRVELGTALFMCAYQNDIRGLMEGNIFRSSDWNANDFYFDHLPVGRSYVIKMGIDLASSEKQRADYTARGIVAEDDRGEFWILSVYRDRRESGHAEFIHEGWMAWPSMGLVLCENQQFQSTLVQTVMETYPFIPIEGRRADTDKVTRARAVAAKYEGHKMHHHVSLKGSDYELELLAFPKGHDDQIDAVGYALDFGAGGLYFTKVRRLH